MFDRSDIPTPNYFCSHLSAVSKGAFIHTGLLFLFLSQMWLHQDFVSVQELCFTQGCIIVNQVSSGSYNPDIPGIPSILLETSAEEDSAAMRINL